MAGYSKRSLSKKLGLKEDHKWATLNEPRTFEDLLNPLPAGIQKIQDPRVESIDFVIAFTQTQQDLMNIFATAKPWLKKDGLLWVCWPKGKSPLFSEINREDVRSIGLASGLVDIKVAAIDEDWSGLKFVYRVKDR